MHKTIDIEYQKLIKALTDYWTPDGPLYRRAFHRVYIEQNFKHKDIVEVEEKVQLAFGRKGNIAYTHRNFEHASEEALKKAIHRDANNGYRRQTCTPKLYEHFDKRNQRWIQYGTKTEVREAALRDEQFSRAKMHPKTGYLHYPKPKSKPTGDDIIQQLRKLKK